MTAESDEECRLDRNGAHGDGSYHSQHAVEITSTGVAPVMANKPPTDEHVQFCERESLCLATLEAEHATSAALRRELGRVALLLQAEWVAADLDARTLTLRFESADETRKAIRLYGK